MKYKIDLGKVGYDNPEHKVNQVDLTVELKPIQNRGAGLTVDFKPVPKDAVELTISANIWNSRHTDLECGGQCIDDIERLFRDNDVIHRLCVIWRRWHLNGMRAGCRIQNEALKEFNLNPNPAQGDRYDQVCQFLCACDGYEVAKPGGGTYKYGTAWLFEEIPVEVIDELRALIGELGGKAS